MLRELDQRTNEGVVVTLAWDDVDDVVVLHVTNREETLTGAVPAEKALDAFHHPFVYLTPESVDWTVPPEAPPTPESLAV